MDNRHEDKRYEQDNLGNNRADTCFRKLDECNIEYTPQNIQYLDVYTYPEIR